MTTQNAQEPPRGLADIAERLLRCAQRTPATLLTLGNVDTGKTTLVGELAERLARDVPTAVVDSDLGQSQIGPPTTVAWGMAGVGKRRLEDLDARELFFAGGLSPPGRFLPLTVAITSACERARRHARVVLVDTAGFVIGDAARALWWEVDRAIRADTILAVEKEGELAPILDGLDLAGMRTCRLTVAPGAKARTRKERQMFRIARYEKYFRNAVSQELSLPNASVQARCAYGLTGRLMAVRDREGVDIAIGKIEEWAMHRGFVRFYGPVVDPETVERIVVGDASPEFESQ